MSPLGESGRATGGILITTSAFTPEAEVFARGKPLKLVTGDELLRMVGAVQKGGDLPDAPTAPSSGPAPVAPTRSESTAAAPQCPQCGTPMVRRVVPGNPVDLNWPSTLCIRLHCRFESARSISKTLCPDASAKARAIVGNSEIALRESSISIGFLDSGASIRNI